MNRHRPIVYLAGPEVFLPDAETIGARKKELCAAYGFDGVFPLDPPRPAVRREGPRPRPPSVIPLGVGAAARGEAPPARRARNIYTQNMTALRMADIVIANLTPFRGLSADPGTAFEVGAAAALDKPVFAYAHGDAQLRTRAERAGILKAKDEAAHALDGMAVEDFGLADNLMLACACARPIVTPAKPRFSGAAAVADLTLFDECLALAAQAIGLTPRATRGDVVEA